MMNPVIILPVPPLGVVDGNQRLWHLSGDTESEIFALAAICHGEWQQREPLRSATGAEEADWPDDDEILTDEDNISTHVAVLTDDRSKSSKMNLLDRLAEILCNHKQASYVTCTSMIESAESITLYAARNARWTDADIVLLENVANVMKQIGAQGRYPYGCTSCF
jgi:hypothetical protein